MADAPKEFREWFSNLPLGKNHLPTLGTMSAALVVFEHLRDSCDLEIEAHLTKSGAQIRGVGGPAVKKILAKYGEVPASLREGGRTSRGVPPKMESLLSALRKLGLDEMESAEREETIDRCQRFLFGQIMEFHRRKKISFIFDPVQSTRDHVRLILEKARDRRQSGQVAQYLVGAKLELRFPELDITNDSYSTADHQLGRPGDFLVGDTAFHVTMTPSDNVYERCQENVDQGHRAYLLVPDEHVQSARSIAKERVGTRVAVEAIESFVGQNVEEMAGFSQDDLNTKFYELLVVYNKRVDDVEVDKSVMIEIPPNLAPK